jgi:hypothetical protein
LVVHALKVLGDNDAMILPAPLRKLDRIDPSFRE